jgi:hypothetical protein
MLLLTVS